MKPGYASLLLEIGTEELPAKGLLDLANNLEQALRARLTEAGLSPGMSQVFATPRRLACHFESLPLQQSERHVVRRGPALAAAYDAEGQPTRAALGFATSCGVDITALGVEQTDKGSWLRFEAREPGLAALTLLPELVNASVQGLPLKRRMRWGEGSVEFLRPVHWVVLLLGNDVVTGEVLGQQPGRISQGHRVHAPGPLEIAHADTYARCLAEQGSVLADFAQRRELIREDVLAKAAAAGTEAVILPELLDEVTGLVEWPVAVVGAFGAEFLALPPEILIATLRDHQKYFHCQDASGALTAHFVTVANLNSRAPDEVRRGNERVVRPRLTDAAFFWQQDIAVPLAERLEGLAQVVFQRGLGSLHDKTLRIAALARHIAAELGEDEASIERAALLSRCDLLTGLVGEFPELQGTLGGHLARATGESPAVAAAIGEFYLPRYAGDAIPESACGRVLAIADRLDTLLACFSIGAIPSGDKDPYALRRTALGLMRILIESALPLDLEALLELAADEIGADAAREAVPAVFDFCFERLRGHYHELGIGTEVFEAVASRRPRIPADFAARLQALEAFRVLPEAGHLAAANKRIANLLKKVEGELPILSLTGPWSEPVEASLAEAILAVQAATAEQLAVGDYTPALSAMARLQAPVDAFFEGVMVMADDPEIRLRRLALLGALQDLFLCVADLSRLPSGPEGGKP